VRTAHQVRAYPNRRAGGGGCAVDKRSTTCPDSVQALTAMNKAPSLDPSALTVSRDRGGRWFVVLNGTRHERDIHDRDIHDRDIHAAKDIAAAAGLAADACGGDESRQGSALPLLAVKQAVGASPQGIPLLQVREYSFPHTAVTGRSCGNSTSVISSSCGRACDSARQS
jgi:hypothetical protein